MRAFSCPDFRLQAVVKEFTFFLARNTTPAQSARSTSEQSEQRDGSSEELQEPDKATEDLTTGPRPMAQGPHRPILPGHAPPGTLPTIYRAPWPFRPQDHRSWIYLGSTKPRADQHQLLHRGPRGPRQKQSQAPQAPEVEACTKKEGGDPPSQVASDWPGGLRSADASQH